jgi:flagellar biosynthesis/type III secretory pathway chaperone
MADDLEELVRMLKAETALCRSLLEVMRRELAALLRSHRAGIEGCGADKRGLIERLQALERQRTEWVNRLARELGRSMDEVTLSWLARTAPGPRGAELRQVRTELQGLVARLQEENRRSALLCRHAGEMLRAAYGVVKGLAASGIVYHRGGRLQGARLNGKLVSDEI